MRRKLATIVGTLAFAAVLAAILAAILTAVLPSDETASASPNPTLAPVSPTPGEPDVTIGGQSGWSAGGGRPEDANPAYGLVPEADLLPYPESGSEDEYTQQLALLQREDGSIGSVSIPRTGLYAPIYEGTDTEAMVLGAGHWTGSSLGGGNVCLFGHNRGNNPWFGELLNTQLGDEIVLESNDGIRTYLVSQVEQISAQDFSWLGSSGESTITLISCVADHPELRLAVRGVEVRDIAADMEQPMDNEQGGIEE